jgi:hypothetical protein
MTHWGRRIYACLVLLGAATACSSNTDDTGVTTNTAIDSVLAIPDHPLLEPDAVEVVERYRMSLSAYAKAGLQVPGDIAFDNEGNLYVLDLMPPAKVVKFNAAGDYVERFSIRWAENETQIGLAQEFKISRWNMIFILDKTQNQLHTFLTLGTHVGSIDVDGVGIRVIPLPEFGEFYLHKWDMSRARSYVLHARAPLDSLGFVYGVPISPERSVRGALRDVYFETATDGHGRLYVAFSDGYPIRIMSPSGGTERLVGIGRDPVPKTAEQIESERERTTSQLQSQAPDLPVELHQEAADPDSLMTLVQEIDVDGFERLWVRTARAGLQGATAYDVFNERGQFLARVEIPGRIEKTAFGLDGLLYVVDATRNLEPTIVGYEVRIGETPMIDLE